MLRQSCDFGIHGFDRRAKNARQANFSCVAFKSGIYHSVNLSLNIACRLRVCECLVRSRLVETVRVTDLAQAGGRSCVPE